MKTKREFLLPYSVKLIYIDKEKSGSGILVPVDRNNCYLITAKHNFTKEKDNPFEKIIAIDNKKIKVLNDKGIEVCKISECVYRDDNPDDDLLVFSLQDLDESIKLLDPIVILKDEPTDEDEHFFRGYPNGEPSLMDDFYSRDVDSSKPNLFTFRNQLQIERNYLAGYSGSGVFIRDKSIFYLVGIVLESKDGIYKYTCYDLSKVIDKINNKINPKIKIKQEVIDIATTENMYARMVNRNKNSFFVKRANQIFKKRHTYKDLKENREKLEKLASYVKNTNRFEELEQEYQKKLADLYLLGAFVSKEYGNDIKPFFEKARFYEPRYIRYKDNLDKIDYEEALKIGKLAFMDKKFNKAIEYLEKALFTNSKSKKIEIYEILTKVYSDSKNLINAYENLIELYDKKDYEKANALYKLSKLYEDVDIQKEKCEEVFNIISDKNNPKYYELEYKTCKRYNQILGISSYTNMRPILERLVQENPKYQEDLDAVIYFEKLHSELEETSEIHSFVKFDSSLKTSHIQALNNELEEVKSKNRTLWLRNLDLKEENEVINKVAKWAFVPIILGIIIAKYGKVSIFGFSF